MGERAGGTSSVNVPEDLGGGLGTNTSQEKFPTKLNLTTAGADKPKANAIEFGGPQGGSALKGARIHKKIRKEHLSSFTNRKNHLNPAP